MNRFTNIFKRRRHTPVKLSIKAVIRWEQLNKKPFSKLNFNDQEDILSLLYTCTHCHDPELSFEEFKNKLCSKQTQRMVKQFKHQISIASQFQIPQKEKDGESQDTDRTYLKDMVAMLAINGAGAQFVLNEMELCDLPLFLQAYDQQIKDRLTGQRLWTFMLLSPHLEKGTTPKDIHPFVWEMEQQTVCPQTMKESADESITFLKTGLK